MTQPKEPTELERAAKESFHNVWPCLIPKASSNMPSCHENQFCGCEMKNQFIAGAHYGRAEVIAKLRSEEAKDATSCDLADWLSAQFEGDMTPKEGG